EFSGNLMMNTDLLSPIGFDTAGTLSQSVVFDTLYSTKDKGINFLIKYNSALKNGIAFSKPVIYIRAIAYLTKTDTTSVTLNSLDINTGALQRSLIVCSASSNMFTLTNECG